MTSAAFISAVPAAFQRLTLSLIDPAEEHILCILGARHFSRAAHADIDLNQNRIRTRNEMTDPAPHREKAP
jgi:hypothetical protein